VVIYLLFGQEILTVLFGEEYAAAQSTLAILALGQMANVATGPVATLLVMTGHERNAIIGIAAGAFLNIVFAFALIPTMDSAGAAVAAAIAIATSNLSLVVVSWRKLGIEPSAFGASRSLDQEAEPPSSPTAER
jgi:O-antigen/teichoic acid export membrane protein